MKIHTQARRAVLALVVVAMTAAPAFANAADSGGPADELLRNWHRMWGKAFDYGACIVGAIAVRDPATGAAALFQCGRLMVTWSED
ncbi:MAG: hypothetical protein HOP12_10370 [Candidatus Eisenbacteria bacterium]|uniref:Serine hydrolase n=1 Tax=Eiseniibacteriota bacterium TaxID=2212470 RepID=A0A849SGR1_UNCEI|nr:hypothetical protein [Candidatus Eisenbacteria bacterium]